MLATIIVLPLLALLVAPITGRPVEGDTYNVPAANVSINGTCSRGGNGGRYRWRNRTSTRIVPSSSYSVNLPISSSSAIVSDVPASSSGASLPGPVLIVTGTTTAQTTTTVAPITTTRPTATVPTSSSAAAPVNNAPAGDAATLLKLHNDFRAKYGAGPLTWSTELAQFAKDYASKCVFKHSGGPYGENLAAGAGGGYTVTSGFNSWANEASKYDWNSPGSSSATGHFTQVVWKATTEVGCGVVQCNDGTIFSGMNGQKSTYVICEYRKAGNMVGNNGQYFRDNVGTLQG